MKIVADSQIPFLAGVLEPFARVEYVAGEAISRRDLTDADALVVRTRTRCDGALLQGTPVKFIATATIGFDHIDVEYCRRHGIAVATAAGCNSRAVLQWTGAVLASAALRYGWRPRQKTIGVVGVGHVGSLVAEYCRDWGFEVLPCDPPRQRAEGGGFVPLSEIARRCDIITFHTPLNAAGPDRTSGMADDGFFGSVRPGSLIINSSRGEVIDDHALKNAIRSRGLTAAIDTWRGEPQIDRELLSLATFATQHIAGYSIQGKARASAMAVEALSSYFGLSLEGWHPDGIPASAPRPVPWDEMGGRMGEYLDIEALTAALKTEPGRFERLRSDYRYRSEFF